MRSSLEPINETGLGVLDAVAVTRKRSICHTLIHDQLHVLYTAAKMSMKVSSNGGVCNFILLVGRIFRISNV